ncbi:hypothetical protein ACFWFU_34730 [Streptomyces sp. NPDC060235]
MAPYKLAEGIGIAVHVTGEEILIACFTEHGFISHRTPSPSSTNVSR